MPSPLTLKMSSSRRLAALFTNDFDASHEKSRCLDSSFTSPSVERRIPKDGDRGVELLSDSSSNISEYLNLDLPCPYLPPSLVSSSSVIHPSNYPPSPSPFTHNIEMRSLLLSYENEYPSPSSIIESPLPVASVPALHPASLLGRNYSPRFPEDHKLLETFVHDYHLCDELGSGGYGFVMTAVDRQENVEVAVKFIIKEKVPEQAWMEDEVYGRIPIEVLVLHLVEHENIIKCLEFFEDELFFYLVSHACGALVFLRRSVNIRFRNFMVLRGINAKNRMMLMRILYSITLSSHTSARHSPYYLLLHLNFRFQILSQKHPRRIQDISRPQFSWKNAIHP
jgi:hypothetical protein